MIDFDRLADPSLIGEGESSYAFSSSESSGDKGTLLIGYAGFTFSLDSFVVKILIA